jgi:hypothetical protein
MARNQGRGSLGHALVAGACGVAALALGERFERRLAGREPVYAAGRVAARFAHRGGFAIGSRGARRLGSALRWAYGPALAFGRGWLPGGRTPGLGRALSFGAMIYLGELLALPATGATPPVRRWPRRQAAMLGAHTLAFALGAELAG